MVKSLDIIMNKTQERWY